MEFNENEGTPRPFVEGGDISQGDDQAVTDNTGGRHGGPNLASGEDDSESHDDTSQHSNSESESKSISQEDRSRVPGASASESIEQKSDCQDDDGSEAEAELDHDDDPGMKAALDLMKRIDEGDEVSDEEYRNVQEMLYNPQQSSREKTHFNINRERLEKLDKYYTNNPMPIPHTQVFDKSGQEWTNIAYLFSQPEAYGTREQAACSPTSTTWAYNAPLSPSGHAPPPSPWVYPQKGVQCVSDVRTDWTHLPPASPTSSASPPVSPRIDISPDASTSVSPTTTVSTDQPSLASPAESTGQPASADRPSTSRVPPGIGLSYMYAAKASRAKNINASQDTAIVSSILSNYYSKGGAYSQETSPKQKSDDLLAKLHRAKGLDAEEKKRTKEEWDEIVSQMQERRMDQKSFKESLIDLETLLQMYQLSRLMATYFVVAPQSILDAFDMAYKFKKCVKPEPQELNRVQDSRLAKRVSMELLGIVPRYEDFPVPYMAGIEVPEKWFFHRFKNISGFDRLRYCTKGVFLNWVTPTRYEERQKLRFCYVRPEFVAQDYAYDCTRLPGRKDIKVWSLLVQCGGPPYKPLPPKKVLSLINPAVLRNFKIRLDDYFPKIQELQLQQRKRVERLLTDRLDVTRNDFVMFEENYKIGVARYTRRCSVRVMRDWNGYFNQQAVRAIGCLQRIIDIAQIAMLLLIKYSDGWNFKMQDVNEMLTQQIPVFDSRVVDQRPQE